MPELHFAVVLGAALLFSSCGPSARHPTRSEDAPRSKPRKNCSWGGSDESAVQTSIDEIFSHPLDFEEKKIRITGCMAWEFERNAIYRSCSFMNTRESMSHYDKDVINPIERRGQPQTVYDGALYLQAANRMDALEISDCAGQEVILEGRLFYTRHGHRGAYLGEIRGINLVKSAP